MYNQCPFFRVTIDFVEMVFAKGDPRIAALYDNLLVLDEVKSLGDELRRKYNETREYLLRVAGHEDILQGNPTLKQRLELREPYLTALNVQQALVLKKMRDLSSQFCALQNGNSGEVPKSPRRVAELVGLDQTTEFPPGLEDTLILTMKGIAVGIQNTR